MAIFPLFASHLPLLLAPLALGAALAVWIIRLPRLAFFLLTISLIAGQLIRIPLPGQGGGLLVSDVAVVLTILSAALHFLRERARPAWPTRVKGQPLFFLITPFLLISLLQLTWHYSSLGAKPFLISFSYLLRLASTLFLLPALIYLFCHPDIRASARRHFFLAALALAFLGLLQLAFYPSLGPLASAGWDPHQGRLVATWLDPNFVGLFFVLAIFSTFAADHRTRDLVASNALFLIALIFTQSRGSYLALALTIILLSPFLLIRLRRQLGPHALHSLGLFFGLIILLSLPAAIIFSERLLGLFTLDATVLLRAKSLSSAWQIAAKNTLVGIGYNAFQFLAIKEGLVADFNIHSRAGTDNSLLNIWITSGLIGLVAFLAPWFYLAQKLIKAWVLTSHWPSFAALASLLSLTIHSFFVNSLLYSHLLITLIIIIALAMTSPDQT